jgi:hypothetical protein
MKITISKSQWEQMGKRAFKNLNDLVIHKNNPFLRKDKDGKIFPFEEQPPHVWTWEELKSGERKLSDIMLTDSSYAVE